MALLDLAATASVWEPTVEVEQGPVPDQARPPELRAVLRRVALNLLVACVIPGIVFYCCYLAFGVWPAIVAGLCWSYGAIGIRAT